MCKSASAEAATQETLANTSLTTTTDTTDGDVVVTATCVQQSKLSRRLAVLKVAYLVLYVGACVVVAYGHLLLKWQVYTHPLDVRTLKTSVLEHLLALRGVAQWTHAATASREQLEQLVANSGRVFEAELEQSEDVKSKRHSSTNFNSASEFLETLEDSRDSLWLVHIVMANHTAPAGNSQASACGDDLWWSELVARVSSFGILTGTFNCQHNLAFCHAKGWLTPQLVLGLVKHSFDSSSAPHRTFVDFVYYPRCDKHRRHSHKQTSTYR